MGFLNFLNKGKQEEKKDNSIGIPPPPSHNTDFGQLPAFSEERDAEIPLPPLEPLEPMEKAFVPDLPFPEGTKFRERPFEISKPRMNPVSPVPISSRPIPAPVQTAPMPLPKFEPNAAFNPFKEERKQNFEPRVEPKQLFEQRMFEQKPSEQPTQRLFPSFKKQKFVRAENFSVMLKHIEDIKTSSELNKSLASIKKTKINSDREFEKFHRSLEEIQRSLVLIDQTIFEEG